MSRWMILGTLALVGSFIAGQAWAGAGTAPVLDHGTAGHIGHVLVVSNSGISGLGTLNSWQTFAEQRIQTPSGWPSAIVMTRLSGRSIFYSGCTALIRVLVDGVEASPTITGTGCLGYDFEGLSASIDRWIQVGPGSHAVTVQWFEDSGAWTIDHWMLTIEQAMGS